MQDQYGTFTEPVTVQPLSRGYAPLLNQSNIHYPEMQAAELNDTLCTICREDFAAGNKVGKLKNCGHIFHENCLLGLLGVPSIYLDPSEPPNMYPYCLRKAVRACGSDINVCLWNLFCALTCCCCCIFCCSGNLHPRRIELTDSDITFLHNPENPRFLADHLAGINNYHNYNDSDGREWFYQYGGLPACPQCRKTFQVRGSYTLYEITD
ncbi:RING finger domain-containing protein [Candidatus Sororendozoicomonas aggregata]|uniref:RING finger domain-containing protein n=1 Tax=Candidatus Sororendozoicomonas aggregata TaxID=3073239 RepID=UPI002ECFF91C